MTLAADGSFTYTPNANFNGTDSFTYTASDGAAASNVATVTMTVTSVNDAPVAVNDSATTAENTAVTIAVLSNDTDADGGTLSVASVTTPAHGTAAINAGGTITYSPAANYSGGDSFSYTISDGQGGSATATVSVTVTNVNNAPVAVNDSATTLEDEAVTIAVLANDTDADGGTLNAVLVSGPATARWSLNPDGSFRYTPAANFNGADSFRYKASDGAADSNVATVTVVIEAVNDEPVAGNNSYSTNEDQVLNVAAPGVLGNDTDIDGGPLRAVLVSGPSHGTVTLNANGSFSYMPAANFSGADSFSYKANDGSDDSNPATVSIARQRRQRCAGGAERQRDDEERPGRVDHAGGRRRGWERAHLPDRAQPGQRHADRHGPEPDLHAEERLHGLRQLHVRGQRRGRGQQRGDGEHHGHLEDERAARGGEQVGADQRGHQGLDHAPGQRPRREVAQVQDRLRSEARRADRRGAEPEVPAGCRLQRARQLHVQGLGQQGRQQPGQGQHHGQARERCARGEGLHRFRSPARVR